MSIVIVVAHAAGAIAVSGTVLYLWSIVCKAKSKRLGREVLEDIAMAFGITLAQIDEVPEEQIHRYMYQRYSRDLFANRFSDLFGSTLRIANWLASIAVLSILFFVAYQAFFVAPADAMMFWLMPFIFFAMGIFNEAMSFVCRLATGRSPGQARMFRDFYTPLIIGRNS